MMRNGVLTVVLLFLFFAILGTATRSFSESLKIPNTYQIAESGFVPESLYASAEGEEQSQRKNSQLHNRGWNFYLSSGPVLASPSGQFYEGVKSAYGTNIDTGFHKINSRGGAEGLVLGFSYQTENLKYESKPGSIKATQKAIEIGGAIPFGSKGSHFILLLGLVSLNHEGESPQESASVLTYEEGSQSGIRVKTAIKVAVLRHLGLYFSAGLDAMRVKIRYPELNNYTETKLAGVLYSLGTGVSFSF